MIRKLSIILAVVLLASIPIIVQGSRGAWKVTDESATNGSLIFDATVLGVGTTNVEVTIEGEGVPVVTCTNQGGNAAPGQNPSRVISSGSGGVGSLNKSGKAALNATAPTPDEDPSTPDVDEIGWEAGGCPSANWTGTIDGVYWDHALLTVTEIGTGAVLLSKEYCLFSTSIVPGDSIAIVACQ